MKITNFSFTLRQATTKDGYDDNYYVNIDNDGVANVSHPYKNIPHKEQAAILGIIQSAIIEYDILVNECDKANRALKLEQYAPTELTEETIPDIEPKSASPQSCALGGGEVLTGVEDPLFDREEEMKENGEAVAYSTEELKKVIDVRKKKK